MTLKNRSLTKEEYKLLWGVLNELLNGYRVESFEQELGYSRNDFDDFFQYAMSVEMSRTVQLDPRQINIFRVGLARTLEEIGPYEFHARTGIEFHAAQKTLSQLNSDE